MDKEVKKITLEVYVEASDNDEAMKNFGEALLACIHAPSLPTPTNGDEVVFGVAYTKLAPASAKLRYFIDDEEAIPDWPTGTRTRYSH